MCGLHCLANLQILTSLENLTKHNRFTKQYLPTNLHHLVWDENDTIDDSNNWKIAEEPLNFEGINI